MEYGLVLAGGGLRGAYQVGVWKGLTELKINVTAIVGTSIGAINGALMIQGDINKLERLYKNIKITDIMQLDTDIEHGKDIFSVSNILNIATEFVKKKGIKSMPLRRTIEKNIDIDKLYSSDIDFGLVAVSITGRKNIEKFKKEIPKNKMIEYLLASACFPIFESQKIGNDKFLDGGLYDNVPINMLLEKKYKNIIVADIAGPGFTRKIINNQSYIKVIRPNEDLGGIFDFNKDKISQNVELGYLDTLKAFNKLQGYIYYFKINEFVKMVKAFDLNAIYGLEYAGKIYKIDKYRKYTFNEFIDILSDRHKKAMEKYNSLKNNLTFKDIFSKNEIKKLFDKGLGLCLAVDICTGKLAPKSFKLTAGHIKNYIQAGKALIELEKYIDNEKTLLCD